MGIIADYRELLEREHKCQKDLHAAGLKIMDLESDLFWMREDINKLRIQLSESKGETRIATAKAEFLQRQVDGLENVIKKIQEDIIGPSKPVESFDEIDCWETI